MDERSQTEQLKDAAQNTMESIQETGEDMQNRLGELWETGREKAAVYCRATDRAIRQNPYQSIGIALGLGVIIGMLLNRGGSED